MTIRNNNGSILLIYGGAEQEIFIVPSNQQEGNRKDRLMAIVRKPAIQTTVDLGYPEQVIGQIRTRRINNYFLMAITGTASAVVMAEGAIRFSSGMMTSGLPITNGLMGFGEISVGLISAISSFAFLLRRENLFRRINDALSAKMKLGLMQNLDTSS